MNARRSRAGGSNCKPSTYFLRSLASTNEDLPHPTTYRTEEHSLLSSPILFCSRGQWYLLLVSPCTRSSHSHEKVSKKLTNARRKQGRNDFCPIRQLPRSCSRYDVDKLPTPSSSFPDCCVRCHGRTVLSILFLRTSSSSVTVCITDCIFAFAECK